MFIVFNVKNIRVKSMLEKIIKKTETARYHKYRVLSGNYSLGGSGGNFGGFLDYDNFDTALQYVPFLMDNARRISQSAGLDSEKIYVRITEMEVIEYQFEILSIPFRKTTRKKGAEYIFNKSYTANRFNQSEQQ